MAVSELLTPRQWQRRKRILILDPDGWRGENGRPFNEPIPEVEFDMRAALSTVNWSPPVETRS